MKKEFFGFINTFKPDNRFLKILLWEAILLVAVVAGIFVWANYIEGLAPLLQQAQGNFYSGTTIPAGAFMMQNSQEMMKNVQNRLLLGIILGVLYLLLVWPFFKCLTYLALLGKKISLKFYWRFLAASVVWALLMGLIITLLQYIFYKTLFPAFAKSKASQVAFIILVILLSIILCYFTITFFISLARSGKIKQGIADYFKTNIKGIKSFLVPMLFSFVVFIALNIIMRIVDLLLKSVTMYINGIFLLIYIVWLKLYYNSCIDRLGKPKHEEKPKARSKVIKHSVRKQ